MTRIVNGHGPMDMVPEYDESGKRICGPCCADNHGANVMEILLICLVSMFWGAVLWQVIITAALGCAV